MKHISSAIAKFLSEKLPEWQFKQNLFVQAMPDIELPFLSVIVEPSLAKADPDIDQLVTGEAQVIMRTRDLDGDYDKMMAVYRHLRVREPVEYDGYRITVLRPKRAPIDYPTSDANVTEISLNLDLRYFVTGW